MAPRRTPAAGPMERLNVTVEPGQATALRRLARQNNLSVSALLGLVIADWLRRPVFFLEDAHTERVQGAHKNGEAVT